MKRHQRHHDPMKSRLLTAALLFLPAMLGLAPVAAASDVGKRYPSEMRTFVDKVTGLTVTALTTSSFSDAKPYQTHTTWTSDGKWIIFRSNRSGNGSQAFLVNETTGDIVQLTDGPNTGTGSLNLSRKSMKLYFMRGGAGFRRGAPPPDAPSPNAPPPRQIIELNLAPLLADSKAGAMKDPATYERVVATLPADLRDAGGFALDADETKLYWGVSWGARPPEPPSRFERASRDASGNQAETADRSLVDQRNTDPTETRDAARKRFEAMGRGPGGIRSIDVQTGEIKTVIDVDFRMGHVQCNPWVPGEIIYCHETTGDAPQRMWTVMGDGSSNRPLYVETPDEWITHETVATRDEVMFLIIGHLPYLRMKPTGIAVINLRNDQMKILGQVEESAGRARGTGGFWHCNGSPDGRWAVGDTFAGNIYVIDRHNGRTTLLTTDHKMRPDHTHPIFSPDSKRVLIQSGLFSDGKNLNLMVVTLPQ
jgi:oligogalacturonide lyase